MSRELARLRQRRALQVAGWRQRGAGARGALAGVAVAQVLPAAAVGGWRGCCRRRPVAAAAGDAAA